MQEVGIRDLRDHLSQYLRDVREGENLTITDHGEPVAQIIPAKNEILNQELSSLLEQGLARWSGGKPEGAHVEIEKGPPVSNYVIEDRR